MNESVLSNHPNWIFVSYVGGSFGHLLSRSLMTSPDSVWYDHPLNGDHPWEWNHFPPASNMSWGVAPAHFVMFFKTSKSAVCRFDNFNLLPYFGEQQLWTDRATPELFNQDWIVDILNSKKIIYSTHNSPEYLKKRFPNCKVILINVSDSDWFNVVKNQIEKTGSFSTMYHLFNAPEDIQNWHSLTGQDLLRDCIKHKHKLNDTDFVKWTAKTLRADMDDLNNSKHLADYVFESKNRTDVDAIVKLHKEIGLKPNTKSIQRVLDAFDLDKMIKKYI